MNGEYTNHTTQDLRGKLQIRRKTTAVVTRQPEKKNIHYVENYYNHTLINFLSPKPQIHNLEKYPLTKQTHNTYIEEPNAPSI